MPKLIIKDIGTFEVNKGSRLVRAIMDQGVDILHRCGGNARCTTCRVRFIEGEPTRMTVAERDRWKERRESGLRLSCQCLVEDDMHIQVINTVESSGLDDAGADPKEYITPDPEWV
jgi:ferredoxin